MSQLKQTVTEFKRGGTAAGLLYGARPLLSSWYGNPLSRESLSGLQAALQHELQARLCSGEPCFEIHVLQFVCNFQRQIDVSPEYEELQAAAGNTYNQALLELVYGQLMISCKKTGARQHLKTWLQRIIFSW